MNELVIIPEEYMNDILASIKPKGFYLSGPDDNGIRHMNIRAPEAKNICPQCGRPSLGSVGTCPSCHAENVRSDNQ